MPDYKTLAKPLTETQLQILALMDEAYTYKQIAEMLDKSPTAVKRHVMKIFHRLGVHSRTAASLIFGEYKEQLAQPPQP